MRNGEKGVSTESTEEGENDLPKTNYNPQKQIAQDLLS